MKFSYYARVSCEHWFLDVSIIEQTIEPTSFCLSCFESVVLTTMILTEVIEVEHILAWCGNVLSFSQLLLAVAYLSVIKCTGLHG